jgi:D-alanyl-lipoteichoic acid acyltransferase DltB (MBOAT superfamily)
MFKKVVIADRLAIYVNGVYGNPATYPAMALALATFFFAFQIYCDFSGYSDIAIGAARVLGFSLMSNFRQPYFARSITDFWRRWHISLSTWLKDYLYIPLGGNRKGASRQKLNLLITFLLSGLWHGSAWHFVAWGALHGAFQVIGRSTTPFRNAIGLREESRVRKAIQICVTFALVCFAWIFFRANGVSDAFVIIAKLPELTKFPVELAGYLSGHSEIGINVLDEFGPVDIGLSGILIVLLVLHDLWARTVPDVSIAIGRKPPVLRWAGYYAVVFVILWHWIGTASDPTQFIYFTF